VHHLRGGDLYYLNNKILKIDTIVPLASASPWNVYGSWSYCIKPLRIVLNTSLEPIRQTNAASFFVIQPGPAFQSELSRLYHLQECTNLISNNRHDIRFHIPGTGVLIERPAGSTNAPGFQRHEVEKPAVG
jgi:hypothetical protein